MFVEVAQVIFKSRQNSNGDYTLIYLLGTCEAHSAIQHNDEPIYGRVRVSKDELSKLAVSYFELKEKMLTSDGKSPAQKDRDYIFHRQEFEELVVGFGRMFLSSCDKQK